MTSASSTRVVVPLAGPDFEIDRDRVKAEFVLERQPLLRAALESRPWWQSGEVRDRDLTFVLRDTPPSRRFAEEALKAWYPAATQVFIGRYSHGAALSALAGIALTNDPDAVLCVDLVDILYTSEFEPAATFAADPELGGVCVIFPSQEPIYSYLREKDGRVIEAAEKRVISDQASAGTYFFRNTATYLQALAHNLSNADQVTYRGLFFVCPLMNGVIASGQRVTCSKTSDVRDIKTA